MPAPKRILVTGAAGAVGAVLCRRLLAEGHEVHVTLKRTSPSWRLAAIVADLRSHHVDLTDEPGVEALLRTVRPAVIYHLAAHGAYPFQTNADGIIQTNILGTWNLLKACERLEYETFVNTGSSSEYGFKEHAMRETDLLEPSSYYAVAKCAQTLLCQHAAKRSGRSINTLRLFSVYGPFEESTRLIPTLIRRCLAHEDLELVAPETARDFVYVDDVVEAFLRIDALVGLSGEIVNIGTGVQRTLRDVVDIVRRHTRADVACRWGAMAAREWDTTTWVADCTKSRRLLGWWPTTTLDEGLARTVEWAREQR